MFQFAHAASHFAPTAKNHKSSRVHVTFIAKTNQRKDNTKLISYFAFVNCAGSEDESAFTTDFVKMLSKEVLMTRRMEAECINTCLLQLQIIFNKLLAKNKLTKTVGKGLRCVLHSCINNQTFLSVLFALSTDQKATESILKFAMTASMVKVKPIQRKGVLDFTSIVKEHIERQDKEISAKDDLIEEIHNHIPSLHIRCHDNYTDIVDAIDQFLGAQLSVAQLNTKIKDLSVNIKAKGNNVTDKIDTLNRLNKVQRNINIAINRSDRIKYILSLMQKIPELINTRKYIAALKFLNQLTTQNTQIKGSAITPVMFSALPKYTDRIGKTVKLNFSEWLHNINEESKKLGTVAISKTKAYLNSIENENEI